MEATSSISPLPSQRDINQYWLEKVLSHKYATTVKIQSWSVKSPTSREGFLSEICFVKVSYITFGGSLEERNLVIKFMPEAKGVVEFVKRGNLGKREVEFYKYASSQDFKVFCQKAGLIHPTPDLYWAGLKNDVLTLVLHDLNSDDYVLSSPAEGNSLNQIKCTLNSIAVIHAAGIAAIKKHGKHNLDIPFDSSCLVELLQAGIEMQIKLYVGTPTADTLKSLLPQSEALINVSQRYTFLDTLIHGDLWTGNVMFFEDHRLASVIDWQFAIFGNPVCDITTLLLVSGIPSVYTDHLTEVLECYWGRFNHALKENGVSVNKTFQDLVQNLDNLWMHGYMFLSASLPDLMANDKITEGRIRAVVSFLEKKGAFANFLQSFQ